LPHLPESCLASVQNVEPQQQIGNGVDKDARTKAARADGDKIEEGSGKECSGIIGRCMLDHEQNRDDDERHSLVASEWNRGEFIADKPAQQEATPENFLDEWHDDHQSHKATTDIEEVRPTVSAEERGIKTRGARRSVNDIFDQVSEGRDPKDKCKYPNRNGE